MTNPSISDIVSKLIPATKAGDVPWRTVPTKNGYELALPGGLVRVKKLAEGSEFSVEIETKDGSPVADETAVSGNFGELFALASEAAKASVLNAILASLDKPPATPDRLLVDQSPRNPARTTKTLLLKDELDLFKRVAGQWYLDFTRGKEYVQITPEGLYLCGSQPHSLKPQFQLRLVATNDDKSVIEWAKEELVDSRLRQIEILTLKPGQGNATVMTGEAKHDQHKLNYTRSQNL